MQRISKSILKFFQQATISNSQSWVQSVKCQKDVPFKLAVIVGEVIKFCFLDLIFDSLALFHT